MKKELAFSYYIGVDHFTEVFGWESDYEYYQEELELFLVILKEKITKNLKLKGVKEKIIFDFQVTKFTFPDTEIKVYSYGKQDSDFIDEILKESYDDAYDELPDKISELNLPKILKITMQDYEEMGVFDYFQRDQIRHGFRDRLDISIYAEPKYNYQQMDEIREGLASGIDATIYADPKYDWMQMYEIRAGLEERLDVSIYADPKYNDDKMEEIRLSMLGKKGGDAE